MIEARYYDGHRSHEEIVHIEFVEGCRIRIASHGLEYSIHEVSISSRLGNTPRVFDLPNGARCKSEANDLIDAFLRRCGEKTSRTHRLERSTTLTIAALAMLGLFVVAMLTVGADYSANALSTLLPKSTLDKASHEAMQYLDTNGILTPTQLPSSTRKRIREHFATLTRDESKHYHLHFRLSKKIGANAFAFPSGDIVLTDGLVALSTDKHFRDILGVLAHEKGHVIQRHGLRMAIKTTISGVVIGYFVGDISMLATALPTLLINNAYSRTFEHEADLVAVQELKRLHVSPTYLADLFEAMEKEHNATHAKIFMTHPLTDERVRFLRESASR
jgi:Zn-dependent protease with chaperone function